MHSPRFVHRYRLAVLVLVSLALLSPSRSLLAQVRTRDAVSAAREPVDAIVGSVEVRAWGGAVHSIPFRHDRSTTHLLSRIRQ
mgnify:CR=1 FL=1